MASRRLVLDSERLKEVRNSAPGKAVNLVDRIKQAVQHMLPLAQPVIEVRVKPSIREDNVGPLSEPCLEPMKDKRLKGRDVEKCGKPTHGKRAAHARAARHRGSMPLRISVE